MSIHDERRPPFCWQSHDAIEAIRAGVSGPERKTALLAYMGLTYLASVRYAQGGRGGFAAGRKEVALLVGIKPDTFDRAALALAELGLVERRARTDEVGRDLSPLWVLPLSPPPGGPETDPRGTETGTRVPPGVPNGDPPKRAHVERQEKENLPTLLGREGKGGSRGEGSDDPRRSLPDDFPPELVGHARAVYRVLLSVARQHAATCPEPTPLAVGRLLAANARKPVVRVAHDFAVWAADPPRPIKNVVQSYGRWLRDERELAATEPLEGGLPSGAGSNVTPLRREHPASRRIRELEELKVKLRNGGTL